MRTEQTPQPLVELIARTSTYCAAPGMTMLRDELVSRYGPSLQAILFYGSCLRSGNAYDGLVDLYVIVDRYRRAYSRLSLGVMNALLPPNVFYLQISTPQGVLRAKYAVLTLRDLTVGCGPRRFHSYFWARFCQPMGLLYAANPQIAAQIHSCLAQSVMTFLNRVLPRLPETFSLAELWQQGFVLTYRSELRVENAQRATVIYRHYAGFFDQCAILALEAMPNVSALLPPDGARYRSNFPASLRSMSRLTWALRIGQGKALSILRLLKAFFTFDGGLDYLIWKLERHSGASIEVSPRLRRFPLIFIWGLMWRLYRQGVFR